MTEDLPRKQADEISVVARARSQAEWLTSRHAKPPEESKDNVVVSCLDRPE
ncbi:MAG: hypothetical protein M3443_18475 [Actinomycetota bacterium]|nr:hypothetical protein [Actinomycetota bacterium]